MSITLGEIATRLGCELAGDPDTPIAGVATLSLAGEAAISFFANSAYREALKSTDASAVILKEADLEQCQVSALISTNPYLTFAQVADLLYPDVALEPGIHARATVADSARVDETAHVAANAFIDEDCEIGEHAYVGPGVVVGPRCRVGKQVRLLANCTLVQDVTIGLRSIIHSGAVVGSDGFGNAMSDKGWVKVKQLGRLIIGDDVEIGANSAVDRGAIGDTVIENGVRLDNLVHIAHNVRIGEHSALAGQVGIAGSATIGKRCMFAGKAAMVGHATICDDVIVNGQSYISKDVHEPGIYSASFPAETNRSWRRKVARFRHIEDFFNRIKILEKRSSENDE